MQRPFAVIIRDNREDSKKTFEAKDATPTDQTRLKTEPKRAYSKTSVSWFQVKREEVLDNRYASEMKVNGNKKWPESREHRSS